MSKHLTVSPNEAADRLAIRQLVEAYAHCADRRDANGQMSLFTADTHFVVYMNAKDPTPSMELHSRDALAPEQSGGTASPREPGHGVEVARTLRAGATRRLVRRTAARCAADDYR